MSKAQRSRLMSLVRGRNTRFELAMMKVISCELYPSGYRYRKHYRGVIGTPDIAFVRQKVAIFFDSDFWHGRNYEALKSRMNPFWRAKIERNIRRDREVNVALRRQGWLVLRFGERQVKSRPETVLRPIKAGLVRP
jgi:DNA mismatch endonuclease (patch repair protein)